MEAIREALEKAKALRSIGEGAPALAPAVSPAATPPPLEPRRLVDPDLHRLPARDEPITRARRGTLKARIDRSALRGRRIVALEPGPEQAEFSQLRSSMVAMFDGTSPRKIGVTSPSRGAGSSIVSANLALSLARMPESTTVLLDFNFIRPSLAELLGLTPNASVYDVLVGRAELPECLLELDKNLFVGLGTRPETGAADLILSGRMGELQRQLDQLVRPTMTVYDLPPVSESDEGMAALPQLDACLMVVRQGLSRPKDLEGCAARIEKATKLLGVVLNGA